MAINSGSSSLKFQLFEMPTEKLLVKGQFERIGSKQESLFSFVGHQKSDHKKIKIDNHKEAVEYLLTFLIEAAFIRELSELAGIGHRVAHGGELFKKPVIVRNKEYEQIKELSALAPLHNPVNLMGINIFKEELPECQQIAVFDTSYHQSIAKENYIYPIPYKYYQDFKIRRYGFHGISHQYIAETIANKNAALEKIVSCHIGNGASICAIDKGKSKLTSMGFTPLSGLMMGTRCGDIDPAIVTYLQKNENMDSDKLNKLMNEESGLLGVSEISNDSRDLIEAANQQNEKAKLALAIYVSKIRQTIGAYIAELGGIDALVFTAGVGENSSLIREKVCENMEYLGIKLDLENNGKNREVLNVEKTPVSIFKIETNEEVMIARDTYSLI